MLVFQKVFLISVLVCLVFLSVFWKVGVGGSMEVEGSREEKKHDQNCMKKF